VSAGRCVAAFTGMPKVPATPFVAVSAGRWVAAVTGMPKVPAHSPRRCVGRPLHCLRMGRSFYLFFLPLAFAAGAALFPPPLAFLPTLGSDFFPSPLFAPPSWAASAFFAFADAVRCRFLTSCDACLPDFRVTFRFRVYEY